MADKGLIRDPSLLSLWLGFVDWEAPSCPDFFPFFFFFPLMRLQVEVRPRLPSVLSEGEMSGPVSGDIRTTGTLQTQG